MTPRTYSSPEAFKQALEQRLRSATKAGAEFARRRQFLVFDRFLARMVAVFGDAVTLKPRARGRPRRHLGAHRVDVAHPRLTA